MFGNLISGLAAMFGRKSPSKEEIARKNDTIRDTDIAEKNDITQEDSVMQQNDTDPENDLARAQEEPAVNTEGSAPADQQPAEDAGEQPGEDLAQLFRSAAGPSSQDKSEEDSDDDSDEDADEDSTDKSPEEKTGRDAMLDLFATKVTEESNVSALAASLEDVDVEDIMGEARKLIRKLKGEQ